MKLRNLLMALVLLLGISAAFASKKNSARGQVALYRLGADCLGGTTVEPACSTTATGPVCTVTNGGGTAYAVAMPVCTVALHRP